MKTKKMIFAVVIIFIIFFMGCSDGEEEFNFSLEFGSQFAGFVDTYSDTLSWGARYDPAMINFFIPEDKMREFYEAFLSYEIYDLPEDVSGVDNSYRPLPEYAFTYTYKNEKRTITCTGRDPVLPDTIPVTPHQRFIMFALMITDYISDTEEFKNLNNPERN